MLKRLRGWRVGTAPAPEGLLYEQYVSLRNQIPLMYAIMFIDILFLGIAASRDVSFNLSVGVPAALTFAIAIRTLVWMRRRSIAPQPADLRRYIRGAVVMAAILSAVFGGWGLLLFNEAAVDFH